MNIFRKKINDLSEIELLKIDKFIEENNGLIFYETKFNKILSDSFFTVLSYFLAYKQGELIGICPCHTFKNKYISQTFSNLSSYEIPYGGWIYNSEKVTLKALLRKTKIPFNEIFHYTSNILFRDNEYLNLKINKREHKTVILNLAPPIEELYGVLMKSKQRNKIERAKKLGITVKEINIENLIEFIRLSSELKNEIGLNQRTNLLYHRIMEAYSSDGKAICLAAYYNCSPISSMILLANKTFAIAWVAGRKTGLPNNLYQNELLWWESIVWAKKFGSKYLDFCGLNEIDLPHLARIKLSFSKIVVPFYSFTMKSYFIRVINKLKKILDKMLINKFGNK